VSDFLAKRGLPGSSPGPRAAAPDFEGDAPAASRGVPPPTVAALDFVSEGDVRSALFEGRKLPVGPSTVITPAARDLGNENNIFLRV
jgi:hypothetical protein